MENLTNQLIMKHLLIILLALASFATFAQDIKTDSSGIQYGIEIDIAPEGAISIQHIRRAKLRSMVFTENLDIVLVMELRYYSPSGVPMLQAIDADNSLSADAKERRKVLFQNYTIAPKTTAGSLVDAATKQVLVGSPVPGRTYIPELLLYQNMTRADLQAMGVTGASTEQRPLQLVYRMAVLAMRQVLTRIQLTP